MTYLAVDPGGTTGVAIWDGQHEPVVKQLSPVEYVMFLEQFLPVAERPVHVIVEGFRIRADTHKLAQSSIGWPLELIGATRSACWRHLDPRYELVLQDSQPVLRFVSNDKLRRAGWYCEGDHARDATRHLYYYLQQRGFVLLSPRGLRW